MQGKKAPEYIIYNPEAPQKQKKNPPSKLSKVVDSDDEECVDECDFPFADMEDRNVREEELGAYDPDFEHLVIVPGLNIKSYCYNKSCTANKCESKESWVRKGYGKYDIGMERYRGKCHSCGKQMDPNHIKTIGFTMAKIKVVGMKIVNKTGVDFCQTFTQNEGKLKYFDDIDSSMSTWASLHIEATKLPK